MASNTTVVRAAGLLVYKNFNPIQYLLLKASYPPYHWTPPKGHVDPGEDEFETAVRETEEEAGLSKDDLEVHKDFEKVLQYKVKGGKHKTVKYWLAGVKAGSKVKLSDEHTHFDWLDLEGACKLAQFPDMVDLLKTSETYLKSKN